MNCQLCQNEFDAYHEGKLPERKRAQVEAHLFSCSVCAENYKLFALSDNLIQVEKNMQSNPFLATRIMAAIENIELSNELQTQPLWRRVFQPALITAFLLLGIFAGIKIGDLYTPHHHAHQASAELLFMDDLAMESLDVIAKNE